MNPISPRVLAFCALVLTCPPTLGAQSYKINGPLPRRALGDVSSPFQVSPDGARAVYLADRDPFGSAYDLFSAPLDASAQPVQLVPNQFEGWISSLSVTADSAHVVFLFSTNKNRLISVPIAGGTRHILNGPLAGQVRAFLCTSDGTRVVYSADEEVEGRVELYVVPVDDSAPPLKLSQALALGGSVTEFRLSPDGTRAVYLATHDQQQVFDLFSAPLDGSAPPVRLNVTRPLADVQNDFRIAFDGSAVVYRADTDADEVYELYRVATDGSAAPTKLNGALVSGGDVLSFELAAASARVVYLADQLANNRNEAFGVLPGSPAVRLNAPLAVGDDVLAVRPSADGQFAAYLTEKLFAVRADGSAPAVELYAPVTDHDVGTFELPPASGRVLFLDLGLGGAAGRPGELYSAPLDGSAPAVRLNGALPHGGNVGWPEAVLADGTVLYLSDERARGYFELRAVPLDGSVAPRVVNDRLVPQGSVRGAVPTADAQRVVYLASQDLEDAHELYAMPTAGGSSIKLSGETPLGAVAGGAGPPTISPRGGRCAYSGTQVEGRGWYLAATDGGDRPYGLLEYGLGSDSSIDLHAFTPDGERFVFTVRAGLSEQVHTSASDGRGPHVALGEPMSSIGALLLTADSTRYVVYAHGQDAADPVLLAGPLDGSAPPRQLSDQGLDRFLPLLTPDDARAVYTTRPSPLDALQLWSVSLVSGPPTRLDQPALPQGGVGGRGSVENGLRIQITADSSRVVYLGNHDDLTADELYSVAVDGSAPPTKLNGPLVAGGNVYHQWGATFRISPDGTRVVYIADQDVDERFDLYSVPADGSAPALQLATGGAGDVRYIGISPDSAHVVFQADALTTDVTELFVVPIAGGSAPLKLSGTLVSGGDVLTRWLAPAFAITSRGRVVYHADQLADEVYELFSVPLDASAPDVRISGPMVGGGYVEAGFRLTQDDRSVVYRAHHPSVNGRFELFQAPVEGSASPRVLNGPLPPGGSVTDFQLTGDGRRVLYRADEETADVYELYGSMLVRPVRSSDPAPPTIR